MVGDFATKALQIIKTNFLKDQFSFAIIGDSIIINGQPFQGIGLHVTGFLRKLRKKKIEEIIFRNGLDDEEFVDFISNMSSRDAVASHPHISVGIIEVLWKSELTNTASVIEGDLKKYSEIAHGLKRFKKLDTVGIEEVVADYLAAIKQEGNILKIIAPVKAYSEYTFVHTTNVTILTLFQAETIGLGGDILHDIGLAALLHDIGKLFVPVEVLEKPGQLDPDEWTKMNKHPVHGAKFLSKMPEIPKLASIVAYEHHMKFDGSGYPETKRIGKKQHIVSQIVAIADVFEALRMDRPYRKSLEVVQIAELLRKGSNKDFNPELLEHFLSSLFESIYPPVA
jgi:HD-GYP domain-containing protein (c-di-GMP phosphodiesterase class II)